MTMYDYRQLTVWQKAIELTSSIYSLTNLLPNSEIFGLVSQMRRSSISIASNIAEGKKRGTKKDFLHFLRVADGSAAELETQLLISKNIYPTLDYQPSEKLLTEILKMLSALIRHVRLKG